MKSTWKVDLERYELSNMNYSTTYLMNTSYSLFNLSTYTVKMVYWVAGNSFNEFYVKNLTIKMCIVYYEQLNHLHDEQLLVLVQYVHLHRDAGVREVWKWFHWIRLEKLG